MNKKIEILRKYAIKQFDKHKDDKNLRVVKSILLESLLEIIDAYGEYINFENIDQVFNRKYKIIINNTSDENHHEISHRFFDENGDKVYAKDGLIVLSYPINELTPNYEIELGLPDEFNLNLTTEQTIFLDQYFLKNEILNSEDYSDQASKSHNLIKENFKIILQHEMSHAMSKGELFYYDGNIRPLIFPVTKKLWASKKYVFDFLGGVLNTKFKMNDNCFCNMEDFNNYTGYFLHEGITEYLVYRMKKNPIKKLKSFVHFGKNYVTPSYAPYVWLMGCFNALYNNILIQAYYNGISSFDDHYEVINKIYNATKKFIISSQKLEELQDDIEELYDEFEMYYDINEDIFKKIENLGLSKENAEELIKERKDEIIFRKDFDAYCEEMKDFDYKECNNVNKLIEYCIYNGFFMENTSSEVDEKPKEFTKASRKMEKDLYILSQKLYNTYKHLNDKEKLSNKQIHEFKYCLLKLVDYNKTWEELTDLKYFYEDYVYDRKNLDKMKEHYKLLFNKENQKKNEISVNK